MTHPLGIASIVSTVVFTLGFVVTRMVSGILGKSLHFRHAGGMWDLADSLVLTATVAPLLYALVWRMHGKASQAQRDLIESEKRFRGLVEQSVAGVFLMQEGRFTYANPGLAEILGFTSAEGLIGVALMSLVCRRDHAGMSAMGRRRAEGCIDRLHYNCGLMRLDGTMVEVEVNSVVALQENVPTSIGVMRDITAQLRVEEAAERHMRQLQAAFMSAVQIATDLTEQRDPYTHGHASRVGEIAAAIGAELGFDEDRQQGLRVAGSLHDIGKAGIPLEILNKLEPLTPQDLALIRKHPQTGSDILRGCEKIARLLRAPSDARACGALRANPGHLVHQTPRICPQRTLSRTPSDALATAFEFFTASERNQPALAVGDIAHQHHERMDGSGYPRGLRGEDIILEARIVAVADVVESMSHERPYRQGMGIARALEEIERGCGTVYDAGVANACLRMFRENGYSISQ